MDVAALRMALSERFGPPQKTGNEDVATLLQWHRGNTYLRVLAGDRIALAPSCASNKPRAR
ncbi:MAG: hypothetical protein WCH04_15190 [Gammaproteobacteria bacterium]